MNLKLLGTLALMAVTTAGCADRDVASVGKGRAPAVAVAPQAMRAGSLGADFAAESVSGLVRTAAEQLDQTVPAAASDRKLIRNGEMTIQVKSIGAALASLGQIVRSVGGQSTNQVERQNEFGARTASMTCLVPAERLDEAIAAARALGEPQSLSFRTEDVTTSYFDVSVRIDTQKQLERQLVALLRRPSNQLSHLLEIEREVARVREEIDRLEGRIRLWDSQIAMSSLVIVLEEPAPIVARTGGPLLTLLASFSQAGENFVITIAGLIAVSGSVLPILMLLGGPAWLVGRLWWRRRAEAASV